MSGSVDYDTQPISQAGPVASTHLDVPLSAAACPLGLAINTIGGRWKLHVLRALLLTGPCRYNELLSVIDGISAKELTRNLRELEASRLIVQTPIETYSVYALTALGKQLEAPFRALGIFGAALAQR